MFKWKNKKAMQVFLNRYEEILDTSLTLQRVLFEERHNCVFLTQDTLLLGGALWHTVLNLT